MRNVGLGVGKGVVGRVGLGWGHDGHACAET
jgi:hypothetical protein